MIQSSKYPEVNPVEKPALLGVHFSVAKGLHNAPLAAESYHCDVVQLFTKNASTWKERHLSGEELEYFKKTCNGTRIRSLASHTSYLINLASPDNIKYHRSCHALAQEMIRCEQLEIPLVVLHPGSHMGSGAAAGIERIVNAVDEIFAGLPRNPTRLLLETTAGQGSGLGHNFEEMAEVMSKVNNPERMGICLDTCHIFAAGYDLKTEAAYVKTFRDFEDIIGLDTLYWIHLNDSKRGLGSRIDRHENIGRGCIGEKAFELLMNDHRLEKIPKVLETPKGKGGKDWDRINLEKLRSFVK